MMRKTITEQVRDLASGLLSIIKFIIRTPREAFLMFRMAGWVILLSGLVRVQPLPRVLNLITPRTPLRSVKEFPSSERLAQLLDMLLGIDAFVFQPICWKRAAVLHRYLALHGIPTRIVF